MAQRTQHKIGGTSKLATEWSEGDVELAPVSSAFPLSTGMMPTFTLWMKTSWTTGYEGEEDCAILKSGNERKEQERLKPGGDLRKA